MFPPIHFFVLIGLAFVTAACVDQGHPGPAVFFGALFAMFLVDAILTIWKENRT